jgi:hypothetical protein
MRHKGHVFGKVDGDSENITMVRLRFEQEPRDKSIKL